MYVTTARSSLLKESAFAKGLVLVPVVVGVLHVLVIVEHIEQLFHVLDVLVALELDVARDLCQAASIVQICRQVCTSYLFFCQL